MSRELRVAFAGEGVTDSRVIPALVERLIDDVSPLPAMTLTISTQEWPRRLTFPEALINVVEQAQVSFDLVVAHVDADARDERQVHLGKVQPAMDALVARELSMPVVWAIPVQAVEAWLLASAPAFVKALGREPRFVRGLSFPTQPEHMQPDKAKQIYRDSIGRLLAHTRRKKQRVEPSLYQERIIRDIPLDDLRRLNSFAQFQRRLVEALSTLGYIIT